MLLLLSAAAFDGARAADLIGVAHVVDGDTLDLTSSGERTRIRLNAMDAPEARQTCRDQERRAYPCGAEASAALRRLIDGLELRCEPRYLDRYSRTVATCFLG